MSKPMPMRLRVFGWWPTWAEFRILLFDVRRRLSALQRLPVVARLARERVAWRLLALAVRAPAGTPDSAPFPQLHLG